MSTRDPVAIERVFIKASSDHGLSRGLRQFLGRELTGVTKGEDALLCWATEVAIETLRVGAAVVRDVGALV